MTTNQISSEHAGSNPSGATDEKESSDGNGSGEPSAVTSPPAEAPAPPKVDPPKDPSGATDADLKDLIKEQNKYLKTIAETSADTNQKTRELHEGILSEDPEANAPVTNEAESEVSIVEPKAPPQPHAVGDEPPKEQTRKGWKRLY